MKQILLVGVILIAAGLFGWYGPSFLDNGFSEPNKALAEPTQNYDAKKLTSGNSANVNSIDQEFDSTTYSMKLVEFQDLGLGTVMEGRNFAEKYGVGELIDLIDAKKMSLIQDEFDTKTQTDNLEASNNEDLQSSVIEEVPILIENEAEEEPQEDVSVATEDQGQESSTEDEIGEEEPQEEGHEKVQETLDDPEAEDKAGEDGGTESEGDELDDENLAKLFPEAYSE
jgi:hypothetical protein